MTKAAFEDRLHERLVTLYGEIVTVDPAVAPARPKRPLLRRPAAVAGIVAALVLAGGGVATAAAVISDRDKNIGPGMADTLRPGEETRIKGMDCRPGSAVIVRLDGVHIGATVAETQPEGPDQLVLGWYMADVTIPATTTPGPHTITITCPYIGDGTEMVQTKPITVGP